MTALSKIQPHRLCRKTLLTDLPGACWNQLTVVSEILFRPDHVFTFYSSLSYRRGGTRGCGGRIWTGVVAMVMLTTLTGFLVTISELSAWFVGLLVFMAYPMLASALYLLPPQRS